MEQKGPRTAAELLGGRRFEELSAEEKALYRVLREHRADTLVKAIVDNLNNRATRKKAPPL